MRKYQIRYKDHPPKEVEVLANGTVVGFGSARHHIDWYRQQDCYTVYPIDQDEPAQMDFSEGSFSRKTKPHGGPSGYYDMPFNKWVTTNDMMEYLAEHKWGRYGIHLKDIFKGICRWGDKDGTTVEYDSKKIIYYGVRILRLIIGTNKTRDYLKELLDDPQFKETK